MKREDCLKHLDRAFTEAPPELYASVEEAFRRGERAVKQRHKIMTAISVAAIFAVLCAALALAAGYMVKPRTDNVVAARGNGNGAGVDATDSAADEATQEARTPAAATPAVTADDGAAEATALGAADATDGEDRVYYANQYGQYFHLKEHCSGMQNAMPCALNTVLVMGKRPCPVCVREDAPGLTYYATAQGVYYHIFDDCTGMMGAKALTEAQALASGKQRCPVCLREDPDCCWATPGGTYYHSQRDCMGMHNARVYTVVNARHLGKRECPICLNGLDAATMSNRQQSAGEGATPEARDTPVYYTAKGNYYHGDARCGGMENARRYTLAEAVIDGRQRCPVCQPGEPDDIDLFRRIFGCELSDFWPDREYACTRQFDDTGEAQWVMREVGSEDAYSTVAVLGSRAVIGEDGTGRNARGEVATPDSFVDGDVRMRLWQIDAAEVVALLKAAPEPVRSMAGEAEDLLRGMPSMSRADGGSPLDWNDWLYVCFDGSRTLIKAVDLFVDGPDTVRFQWLLNDGGGYDLALTEINGERQG